MSYIVEVVGPGFSRSILVHMKMDAERVHDFWRKRGMSVTVYKVHADEVLVSELRRR